MSRSDAEQNCYICGLLCTKSLLEWDHFPIGKVLGGLNTLPICRPCHDLKDRLHMDRWDPEAAFIAVSGVWGKANRDERLVLAKMFHVMNQLWSLLHPNPDEITRLQDEGDND